MPTGAKWDKKGLPIRGFALQKFRQQSRIVNMSELPLELLALAIELIRQALEKEHPKDEFLEFRCIHLARQDVGGLEKEGFKLTEGDFFVLQLRYLTLEGGSAAHRHLGRGHSFGRETSVDPNFSMPRQGQKNYRS
jgi:hypothetical protein